MVLPHVYGATIRGGADMSAIGALSDMHLRQNACPLRPSIADVELQFSHVGFGPRLCKNAATCDDDRINVLPNRVWVLEDWRARLIVAELRKVILIASQFFEFLHGLGH